MDDRQLCHRKASCCLRPMTETFQFPTDSVNEDSWLPFGDRMSVGLALSPRTEIVLRLVFLSPGQVNGHLLCIVMDIEPVCWCIAKGLHVHERRLLPLSAVIDIDIDAHSFFHVFKYFPT